MKRIPQLILFDGATGAGKSSLLKHLREEYSRRIFVGAKLTTRQRRTDDNTWEFRFVETIPQQYGRYSFQSVGNHYAIDHEELSGAVARQLIYAVSCVDRQIMERLRSEFNTLMIYVYRSWTEGAFESLITSRETSESRQSQLRLSEVEQIASKYIENLDLYAHVILNIGPMLHFTGQLSKILSLYGVTGDVVTK